MLARLLNGSNGGLQYTLRFGQSVDLDLHVVEPSTCEVWWGDPNRAGRSSSCNAVSSLDLDSNAGCNLDDVNLENVIFGPGKPAWARHGAPDGARSMSARAVAAGRDGVEWRAAGLQIDDGKGWKPRLQQVYANRVEVLATTDVDGDGEREAIVHAAWANDDGLYVFGGDWSAPLYGFSCGNI